MQVISKLIGFAALALLPVSQAAAAGNTILIEAEMFDNYGGWVLDQQFMDQMGSPYLMAHGLGDPVKDAVTSITLPAAGRYRVWARTHDWVAPFKAQGAPGKFQVVIDGQPLAATFGAEGADWYWQDGGTVEIKQPKPVIALHDLTGFEGRCDAIILSSDAGFTPPNDAKELAAFRRQALALPERPEEAGEYDLVVVGGGIAGCCAAVVAARLDLKVALIQDRPVLGGNNSSEVRVWLGGDINKEPYPRIGDIVREFEPKRKAHYGPENTAEIYEDDTKAAVVQREKNISLFCNMRANQVEKDGPRIKAVIAQDIRTARQKRFAGKWFVDCTGDGGVGFLAKADSEMTMPGHMGQSNLWNVVDQGKPAPFPRCPWAADLSDKPFPGRDQEGDKALRQLGVWYWEAGFNRNPLEQGEYVRDTNFRGMYGAWDALKNVDKKFPNHKLIFAAYISGPRETRRLLGDHILTKEDLLDSKEYPDGIFPTGWDIDVHVPETKYEKGFGEDPFLSRANFTRYKRPYWVPYRTLYSRNVPNLFMAGRDISVTHDALGAVRVMRTCGMMGEIVGMAASLCLKNNCDPRGVYEKYLTDLKEKMKTNVGKLPPVVAKAPSGKAAGVAPTPPDWLKSAGMNLARAAKVTVSSVLDPKYAAKFINDGKAETNNDARWVSDANSPGWVEFAWDSPQTINAARVVSGYQTGGAFNGVMEDFRLQTYDGKDWKDVPGAAVKDNSKVDCGFQFPDVTTARLRLLITATPDDRARLYEMELYRVPSGK
ncbi:MAG: FAD-dependent oxidoreductase [Candidatus Sumerlaeota bacterium]|nr:FAD-dependent oxidoreductase [Candidatus Sumerlaeota bacterium]